MHLSHCQTKVCILAQWKSCQVSVARKCSLLHVSICCQLLASQRLLKRSKEMDISGCKIKARPYRGRSITVQLQCHSKAQVQLPLSWWCLGKATKSFCNQWPAMTFQVYHNNVQQLVSPQAHIYGPKSQLPSFSLLMVLPLFSLEGLIKGVSMSWVLFLFWVSCD